MATIPPIPSSLEHLFDAWAPRFQATQPLRVNPGRIHELRLLLRAHADQPALIRLPVQVRFLDAAGSDIGTEDLHMEAFAGLPDTPAAAELAVSSRFVRAPHRAVRAKVCLPSPAPAAARIAHQSMAPVHIGLEDGGQAFMEHLDKVATARRDRLVRLCPGVDVAQVRAAVAAPAADLRTLIQSMTVDQDPDPGRCLAPTARPEAGAADTLPDLGVRPPTVVCAGDRWGTILAQWHQVIRARATDLPMVLGDLPDCPVVLELAPPGWAPDGAALAGLGGDPPPAAPAAVLDSLRRHTAPVTALITAGIEALPALRPVLAVCQAVTVQAEAEDHPAWHTALTQHGPPPTFLPHMPAPAGPATRSEPAGPLRVLVPVAPDLVETAPAQRPWLLAQGVRVADWLPPGPMASIPPTHRVPVADHADLLDALGRAHVALLWADGVLPAGMTRDLILDTVAASAIPMVLGTGALTDDLARLCLVVGTLDDVAIWWQRLADPDLRSAVLEPMRAALDPARLPRPPQTGTVLPTAPPGWPWGGG